MAKLLCVRASRFKTFSSSINATLPQGSKCQILSVHGPNGIGKSCFLDAIAFGLGASTAQLGVRRLEDLLCKATATQHDAIRGRATSTGEVELKFVLNLPSQEVVTLLTLFDNKARRVYINGKASTLAQLHQFVYANMQLPVQPSLAAVYIKQATTSKLLSTSQDTSNYLNDSLGLTSASKAADELESALKQLSVATKASMHSISNASVVARQSESRDKAKCEAVSVLKQCAQILVAAASTGEQHFAGRHLLLQEQSRRIVEHAASVKQQLDVITAEFISLHARVPAGDPPISPQVVQDAMGEAATKATTLARATRLCKKSLSHCDTALQETSVNHVQAIQVAEMGAQGSLRKQAIAGETAALANLNTVRAEVLEALTGVLQSQALKMVGVLSVDSEIDRFSSILLASQRLARQVAVLAPTVSSGSSQYSGMRAQQPHLAATQAVLESIGAAWLSLRTGAADKRGIRSNGISRHRLGTVEVRIGNTQSNPSNNSTSLVVTFHSTQQQLWLTSSVKSFVSALQHLGEAIGASLLGAELDSPVVRAHELCRFNFMSMPATSADIDASSDATMRASLCSTLSRHVPRDELAAIALLCTACISQQKLSTIICNSAGEAASALAAAGTSERITVWPQSELGGKAAKAEGIRTKTANVVSGARDAAGLLTGAPCAGKAAKFAIDLMIGPTCFARDAQHAGVCVRSVQGVRSITLDGLQHSHGSVKQVCQSLQGTTNINMARMICKHRFVPEMMTRGVAERQLEVGILGLGLSLAARSAGISIAELENSSGTMNPEAEPVEGADPFECELTSTAAVVALQRCMEDLLKVQGSLGFATSPSLGSAKAVEHAISCVQSLLLEDSVALDGIMRLRAAIELASKECAENTALYRDSESALKDLLARFSALDQAVVDVAEGTDHEVRATQLQLWQAGLHQLVKDVGNKGVASATLRGTVQHPLLVQALKLLKNPWSTQKIVDETEKALTAFEADVNMQRLMGGAGIPLVAAAKSLIRRVVKAVHTIVRSSTPAHCGSSNRIAGFVEFDDVRQVGLILLSHLQECADDEPTDGKSQESMRLNAQLRSQHRVATQLDKLVLKNVTAQLVAVSDQARKESVAGINASLQELVPAMVPRHSIEVLSDDIQGFRLAVARDGQALNASGLSGGQRSMIACALLLSVNRMHRTPLLLLDEVDAALDATNRARYASILAEHPALCDTQVIVVSHHDMVRRVATHCIELERQGHQEGEGSSGTSATVIKIVPNDQHAE